VVLEQQLRTVAHAIIRAMPPRDREVLVRFYIDEQEPARICEELGMSEGQFRNIKSRAKTRLGKLARKRIERTSLVVEATPRLSA
jgi:RNA polymerase sigma-70 factor (ECF subfamily)